MQAPHHSPRLTRRRLLVLLGGSAAATSLLATTGHAFAEAEARDPQIALSQAVAAVLAPAALGAAQATDPLAGYRQATQTGFSPINSTLTFGAPTDVAAGWDGTVWAIDGQGAPHLYDPLTVAQTFTEAFDSDEAAFDAVISLGAAMLSAGTPLSRVEIR